MILLIPYFGRLVMKWNSGKKKQVNTNTQLSPF